MNLPGEVAVMTLPNVTLFPHSLLPLHIFEPRYRRMLEDALESSRMFAVAMQRTGTQRETPLPIAGLGLIRVSVRHGNGTSHLVLQGIARVELGKAVRYRPYRVHRITTLQTRPCNSVAADALLAKVRELLAERLRLGLPFAFPVVAGTRPEPVPAVVAVSKQILCYLDSIKDPEHAADLVTCAVLPRAVERQTILETIDVEARLRRLIRFLLAEIREAK